MSEQPLSSAALYTARPTVRINGAEHDRITLLLTAMDLKEEEHGLSAAELRFTNVAADEQGGADFAFEDEGTLKLGDTLSLYAGDESSPMEIFSGLVMGIEVEFSDSGAPTLIALAEDKLQHARMKRRTRTFESKSVADIAREIAADHGLTATVNGFSSPLGTEVQLNESDLAFLRRLLSRCDGDVQIVGNELQVSPRGDVRRGSVDLALNSQLRRVSVLADLAHQVTEVTVTGWNPAQGRRVIGRSTGSHQGPGNGRTGAEILRNAIGVRSHQLSHLAVTTDEEATSIVDAAYDERQRRFVTAHGTAEGNPAIRVGTHVNLAGIGPRFSNTYYVTRCRHRFDLNQGYETDFTGECAFLGRP